ncbi:hypothetical protein JCM3770_006242 [Rhodotorula araucariae]
MVTQPGTPPCTVPSAAPALPPSSYSASLPATYRLSAFPVSPSEGSALPPGLGLAQRGCASDDERDHDAAESPSRAGPAPVPRTARGFDPSVPPPPSISRADDDAAGTSSGASSRKGSAGSFSPTETDDGDGDGGSATPLSSLAGSLLSEDAGGSSSSLYKKRAGGALNAAAAESNLARTSPAVVGALEWGVRTLVVRAPMDDAAKREREARAVRRGWEDPALAAARRALWDDVPADEARREEQVHAREPVLDEVSVESEADDEEDEDAAPDAAGNDDDHDDEWELPPVRLPCHTTLAPRPSCLRYSPAARTSLSLPSLSTSSSSPADDPTSGRHSPSAASSASTSAPSVSFSCAPPQTCATWSAEVYSRRGDAPVEKLSIREWIELQGVREAVGVWSGKIAKWDQVLAADAAAPATAEAPASKGRPACQLAAVVGVVHVSRSTPSSPVNSSTLSLP